MNIKANEIKLVKIKDLKPHPKNRNKHPKEQIDRLCELIKYQGFRKPIVVSNKSGFITAGHGRLEAAKKLKMKEVPVIYQDYDTDDQEYADMTADNAIAAWAEMDFSGINIDLADLGPDLNLDMLGIKNFSLEPSDKLVDQINKGNEASEWVSMPDWKPGEKEIRLIIYFKSEEEREKYTKDNNIPITRVMAGQWISRN